MSQTNRPLGRTIRAARLASGLTQNELASALGVSQSTISFWERGVEAPTVEHLLVLATQFPSVLEWFEGSERELLQRVMRLERDLFSGRCACASCACEPETSNTGGQ